MLFKKKNSIDKKKKLTNEEAKKMFDFNLNYIGLSPYSDQTVVKTSELMVSNHIKAGRNNLLSEEWLRNYKADNNYLGYNASISAFFEDDAITTFSSSDYFEDERGCIYLPKPSKVNLSLEVAIQKRRSLRKYKKRKMKIQDLAAILHNSAGITGETSIKKEQEYEIKLRACPSAGGLYPVTLYFWANNIEGIENGIYEYLPYSNAIRRIETEDFNIRELAEFSFINVEDANIVFMYIYSLQKNSVKYGNQATTYAMIETGEIAQNIQLIATALLYGACDIGGYEKERVEKLLNLDGTLRHMIHMTIVGSGE